jgi:hypothetical protein
LRFLAGAAFFAARLFVAFLAGGTVTTFHMLSLGEVSKLRRSLGRERECSRSHLLGQEPCTWALNFEPTENFALLRSGICTG